MSDDRPPSPPPTVRLRPVRAGDLPWMAAMVCGRLSVGEHNWGGKPREPAEQAALEKIGMIVEGVVRDAEFRNGAYQGHTLFSVLRSEWDECRG